MQFDPKSFILDDEPWNFQILSEGKVANTRPAAVGDSQVLQGLMTSGDQAALVEFVDGLGATPEDRSVIAGLAVELKPLTLVAYITYSQERLAKKFPAAAAWVRSRMAAAKPASAS